MTQPGYLDDEEYSHFVQQLGSRRTFVEFRRFVRGDEMAARAMERVQILLNDGPTMLRLIHLVRLKWLLLELHLNRIRVQAGWYADPTGHVLDDSVLPILDELLAKMVAAEAFTEREGRQYRASLREYVGR